MSATRTATWYFDVISPYAYLHSADLLAHLPASVTVVAKPVLFAGLLNHWGHKGPVEIPAKRVHTYRQSAWLTEKRGLPFRMPPRHPFNPLAALRLLCGLGPSLRQAHDACCFVFGEGGDPSTPDGIRALGARLGVADPEALAGSEHAKQALRANGEAAIAAGVWGVPTVEIQGELFWGADSFPMLLDWLADPGLFESDEMRRLADLPIGQMRKGQG
jgi:2-hydroxychromene-2-carboxylate isomerase